MGNQISITQLKDRVRKLQGKIDLLYKIMPQTSGEVQGIGRDMKAIQGADATITKLIFKYAEVAISKW